MIEGVKNSKPMPHFLQSEAWGNFQQALGRKVFYDQSGDWQYLAILEAGRGNKRLYCPYGPTVRDAQALSEAIDSLVDLAKKQHCDFIRIEPIGDINAKNLTGLDLIKARYDIQPAHTWCIDLNNSEEDILLDMSASNRGRHRNIYKKGVTFTTSHDFKDIDKLLDLLHGVASHNSFSAQSDEYLQKQADILLSSNVGQLDFAWYEGECIAAALIYSDDTTKYYAHAAADFHHRKLQAGTPLVSNMILAAKKEGKKVFDLYGVAPTDDPTHPWAGFSVFKKSFGGYQKDYLGTWELPINKMKYKLYSKLLARK